MEDIDLANYIKYCLGYVKLTQRRTFVSQQRYSTNLPSEYFGLIGLLNLDLDGKLSELINFETFYSNDPKNLSEEIKEKYEFEKNLAKIIDDIYNKHKNDQFTKQIVLNFGYFEIEMPVEILDEEVEKGEGEENLEVEVQVDRYPLFSVPVRIEKELSEGVPQYYVYTVDPEIHINVGMLESVLDNDLYYQLVEKLGEYENNEKLILPITEDAIFVEIWHLIKAQLKLKDVAFDEKSFKLEEIHISLGARSNYFLAEDLHKLSKLKEKDLSGTSLTSWTNNEGLSAESNIPGEKELYFPFLYDKFQLRVLKVINNKASVIQGPPGTGKSETISNLLCHLAANGKKVLFVSQKAQALKVVKDKLKKLDIPYLFGYLPNPASAQLNEIDEEDGIAIQLTALGSLIEKMSYENQKNNSSNKSLDSVVKKKQGVQSGFIDGIECERKVFNLMGELNALKEYDLELVNLADFSLNFSKDERDFIRGLIFDINRVEDQISQYNSSTNENSYRDLFSTVDFSAQKYFDVLEKFKEDYSKSGYDRNNKIIRKCNNFIRNFRLGKQRSKLPREIVNYIDSLVNDDISKSVGLKKLSDLSEYILFCENNFLNEDLNKKLINACSKNGINLELLDKMDAFVESTKARDVDQVKERILKVSALRNEIDDLKKDNDLDLNRYSSDMQNIHNDRSKRIALYLKNIINKDLMNSWKGSVSVKQIITKLAKAFGKSKKAFKTFDKLRNDPNNFKTILNLIPIWTMELDDASRIVPLEANLFDYVVLDEASQCNIAYTLPVMFRAGKAVFVGDSEQMRDSTIMFKSNRSFDELAKRYKIPEELQIKSTGSAVQSILDIATSRGFWSTPLRFHYRSPSELIGFSNKSFYKPKGKELIPLNNSYLAYKDTNRVMLTHRIKPDWNKEISEKVNVAEAKAILEFFKEIKKDDYLKDKSVGILSFFNSQATYIRELFEKEGFKEDENNYKVSIIEGIQGDEKDIIIYSFVIKSPDQKNKYYPLTGEGGDIRGDINRGRVNVAFSRARLQVHCFTSLDVNDMPDKIWLKKYLEYVEKQGKVDFYSTELKPFDSNFEKEFYGFTREKLDQNYLIQNQVKSCGFKIDFVITNSSTGKRIAVECDGPTHFKNELDEELDIYVDSDEERQRVLEAAGWRFYRLKYSDWINPDFKKNKYIEEMKALL